MGTVIYQSSWYAKGNKKMMRHGPENIFPPSEWLTSVAIPFEVSGRAGFGFGCKVCWVGPNGAWGQRFS